MLEESNFTLTEETADVGSPANASSTTKHAQKSNWKQLGITTKKCWLSKARYPITTLFEVLAPVIVVLVLVAVRPSVVDEHEYVKLGVSVVLLMIGVDVY